MKTITFEPVMDGRRRKLVVNDRVNGYKHTEVHGIHYFSRGNISYIIDMNKEASTLRKFDYSTASYLYVTYDEFHKFLKIESE